MLLNALRIGEILSIGGLTTLIGIGVTFLTLVLLVFSLTVMNKGMNIKRAPNKQSEQLVIQDNALTQNAQSIEITPQTNNNEVIAAIMAAISVIMSQDNVPQNKAKASFVVKSIRRI